MSEIQQGESLGDRDVPFACPMKCMRSYNLLDRSFPYVTCLPDEILAACQNNKCKHSKTGPRCCAKVAAAETPWSCKSSGGSTAGLHSYNHLCLDQAQGFRGIVLIRTRPGCLHPSKSYQKFINQVISPTATYCSTSPEAMKVQSSNHANDAICIMLTLFSFKNYKIILKVYIKTVNWLQSHVAQTLGNIRCKFPVQS